MPAPPTPLPCPRFLSPRFDAELKQLGASARDERMLREFRDKGYVVFDLEDPRFEERASDIRRSLATRYPEHDRRLMEAWYDQDSVRQLASDAQVLRILELLYGRRPVPFQTLNFDSGTEQAAHSDTIHFHCTPERFMCGVWIALEDIDGGNGPLVVYPESHKLEVASMQSLGLRGSAADYPGYELAIQRLIESEGLEAHELHLKKGQAVLWAANLLHGGSAIKDPDRSRHSQVTHYYFEGCMYYLPLASDASLGLVCLREVIDIAEGKFIPNMRSGRAVKLTRERRVLRYPRPLPNGIRHPRDLLTKPARLYHRTLNLLDKLRGREE